MGYLVPFDRRLIMDVMIPNEERQRRQARRHGGRSRSRAGRRRRAARSAASLEVLGDIEEPGVDTEIIIRKYGITDEHSDEAVAEAKRLGGAVKEKDIKGRTDFRPITTVTIDGEHARDFDDAITIEKLPNGNYWLGVHIADVAHYVPEGSALDEEAYERCDLGLLPGARRPHVPVGALDRAVQPEPARRSARAVVPDGDRSPAATCVRYEIHDGVIHSDARMTYTDVNAILTDRDPALIEEVRAARADVRDDAGAVRDPERAPQAPRLDRLRPEGARDHPRRRGDGRSRSSRSSATSRTG